MSNVLPFQPQKPLPHDIEAEQALLGACLSHGEAIDIASRIVTKEDFHDLVHARTWSVLQTMRDGGHAVTPGLLAAAMGMSINDEIAPGVQLRTYITRLATEATTVLNVRDYANAVLATSNRRKIIAAANAASDAAYAGDITISTREIAAQAITDMDAIASSGASAAQKAVSLGQAATAAVDKSIAIADGKAKAFDITWGHHDLNEKTNGMEPGDLVIIGGRPGMGKTTLGLSIGLEASKQKQEVLFFSLEMMAVQLAQRAVAWHCFTTQGTFDEVVTYKAISAGKIHGQGVRDRLLAAEDYVSGLPFHIEQEAGLTMGQISVRARRYKESLARQGKKLKIIVVDHLGIIRMDDRYRGNRVNEVSQVTAALKVLAKELECAVIALCQLSRATESREDKRPGLGDFRDSGSIEQDADMVIGVYREEYYLSKHVGEDPAKLALLEACQNTMEAIFLKQRQGDTGPVRLFASMNCNFIGNLEQHR